MKIPQKNQDFLRRQQTTKMLTISYLFFVSFLQNTTIKIPNKYWRRLNNKKTAPCNGHECPVCRFK